LNLKNFQNIKEFQNTRYLNKNDFMNPFIKNPNSIIVLKLFDESSIKTNFESIKTCMMIFAEKCLDKYD